MHEFIIHVTIYAFLLWCKSLSICITYYLYLLLYSHISFSLSCAQGILPRAVPLQDYKIQSFQVCNNLNP